ncbi:MAG: GAF domain-containing protein [Bdellovibrionales bacterium]|nr:GAF domain-containing protein [Bdellovibrionales bacterium]
MKKETKQESVERLRSLIDIGVALSSEKELNNLLKILLDKSIEVTHAEGASIYLYQEKATHSYENVISLQKKPQLVFLRTTNRRVGQQEHNGVLPVDNNSIAGFVAKNRKILRINNCYDIPQNKPYNFNDKYDLRTGYKTKSMLTVPMITADGKIRGVLQLINKLSDKGLEKVSKEGDFSTKNVISFSNEDEELMQVFASYAAIALENSQLTESIENLFESFVRASVKAIEARDPTTSGHSDRVAMMTVELALATHKVTDGPYKNLLFSEEQLKEIRYASLLHDFGKIGVTEPVLLKKKKLHDRELESILLRFDAIVNEKETRIWRNLCEQLVEKSRLPGTPFNADLALKEAIQQIETIKSRVRVMRGQVITANEPQVMSADFDIHELIEKIEHANQYFGNKVLTQKELRSLSIPRGSLNAEERQEIESHVSHTYEFLKQIAWTDNLSHVTEIAHCHHEKLDGTGYPRGIEGEKIPIQARMMTIADIYDALTAFDRPYKKSLSPARALEILVKDARAQKIDGYLLKIFIEAGIFHHATLGTHKRQVG